ncbi:hypothetical protein ACSYAD_26040 [Acaryochloris marina NIES-2412]|uniref:hypothetical protein n=1 Tax=Acaryochloris marina TaxID=155978 RepID=UPI00405941DA
MTINLPKINLSLRNIVTASLGVIALSTFLSLAILSDVDIEEYTPAQWVLSITGSFSAASWMILILDRSQATEQALIDIQEDIESLACEIEVLNRATQMRELADLVEAQAIEAQAKITLLGKIRELKAESNPMEDLEDAIEICLDADLWDEPARYKHRYQDTEQFYDHERICPVNRDGRVEWEVCPDYDPHEDEESYVRQTPFVPFDCCFTCKYIGDSGDCAVVPLGCETGDLGELCREYQSEKPKDGPELVINLGESLRLAQEDTMAEELVSMRAEQFQLERKLMTDFASRLQEQLANPSSKSESVDFSTEIVDTIADFDSSPSKSLRITLNGKTSLSNVAVKRPCGYSGYNWATPSEVEIQGLIQDPRFKELLIFFTGKNFDFTFEQYPQFNLAESLGIGNLDSVFKENAWKLLDEYEVVSECDFWVSTLNNFWKAQSDVEDHCTGSEGGPGSFDELVISLDCAYFKAGEESYNIFQIPGESTRISESHYP